LSVPPHWTGENVGRGQNKQKTFTTYEPQTIRNAKPCPKRVRNKKNLEKGRAAPKTPVQVGTASRHRRVFRQ